MLIPSAGGSWSASIGPLTGHPDEVQLRIVGNSGSANVAVRREDLLTAVADELGVVITDPAVHEAIIMDKPPEPLEVTEGDRSIHVGGLAFFRTRDPQHLLDVARKYVVAANWLREHPPVDKAQVKVLADLLNEVDPARTAITETTARRLLETGKVTVTP